MDRSSGKEWHTRGGHGGPGSIKAQPESTFSGQPESSPISMSPKTRSQTARSRPPNPPSLATLEEELRNLDMENDRTKARRTPQPRASPNSGASDHHRYDDGPKRVFGLRRRWGDKMRVHAIAHLDPLPRCRLAFSLSSARFFTPPTFTLCVVFSLGPFFLRCSSVHSPCP